MVLALLAAVAVIVGCCRNDEFVWLPPFAVVLAMAVACCRLHYYLCNDCRRGCKRKPASVVCQCLVVVVAACVITSVVVDDAALMLSQ